MCAGVVTFLVNAVFDVVDAVDETVDAVDAANTPTPTSTSTTTTVGSAIGTATATAVATGSATAIATATATGVRRRVGQWDLLGLLLRLLLDLIHVRFGPLLGTKRTNQSAM